MIRRWDIQYEWNPWISVGVHIDHIDPSVTLHFPLGILALGRLKQPGFSYSLIHNDREDYCIREVESLSPPCPVCGEDEAIQMTTVTYRPCVSCADEMDTNLMARRRDNPHEQESRP